MTDYLVKDKFFDYDEIVKSPLAPGVSIIAPAFNESLSIVENIRSLLALHYSNFEVIIVNDGSKDDTLARAIEEFHLVKTSFYLDEKIYTKKVRAVYKSMNPAFSKLVIVDKENGGKADALNAGINVSTKTLFAAIDVDCVLDVRSILKMVRPFITSSVSKRVIAT
ncbi:MAG: glycosyltransferase family 2 protein [Cyclobacteriaceae bacterium]|nr:glycosyltransferase family 2 protein [Cyclobacteriaceae bacterium]